MTAWWKAVCFLAAAALVVVPVAAQTSTASVEAENAERAAAAAWDAAPVFAAPQPAHERAPLGATIYSSNFDSDNGGLGSTLDWQWAAAYAWTGATCTGTFAQPPAAHSGTGMWGTVLNSCYSNLGNNQGSASGGACNNTNPADDSILTLNVDLTNYTSATLTFWEWFDVFTYFDWTEVRVNNVSSLLHCEPSYTAPTQWVQRTVDLTPFVGAPATIAWHMLASTVVDRAGWYIDDVAVQGAPVPVELQSLSVE